MDFRVRRLGEKDSHVRSREGTEGGEPTRTGTEQNGGVTETDRNERERRRTDVMDERVEWEVVSVVGPGVRICEDGGVEMCRVVGVCVMVGVRSMQAGVS